MWLRCSNCEVLTTLTPDTGRILSKLHTVQPKGKITFCTGIRVAHVSGFPGASLLLPLSLLLPPCVSYVPCPARGSATEILLSPCFFEQISLVLPHFPCLQMEPPGGNPV